MRYHNITKDDINNGDGLRVVLWVSGCNHHCEGCHNKITWDCNSGLNFDIDAEKEIFEQLDKDYISGITFSGGDPLYTSNLLEVASLCSAIKDRYPTKSIWLYTGSVWEDLCAWERMHQSYTDTNNIIQRCKDINNFLIDSILEDIDVLVDGRFIKELTDVNYHWAGSTNQRVIDVKESLRQDNVVIWNS